MSLLTAEKARDLARAQDPSFAVEKILIGVSAAAKHGEYLYITREYGFGEGVVYRREEEWPALNQAIVKKLRELGYKVRQWSKESQFVDVWLEISWEAP